MKCHRCNQHTGTFDPPHSCIYDERDQLLKKVAALETEIKSKSTKCPHSCPYDTDGEYFGP